MTMSDLDEAPVDADIPTGRFRFTSIAHSRHRYLSPISEARVTWLLRHLGEVGLRPGCEVLDIGCGKAELLLRIADRFDGRCTGVDPNAAFMARARRRADELGLGAQTTWLVEDACVESLPVNRFDLVCCIGASHAIGGFSVGASLLRPLLSSDGSVLMGEGYWRQPPVPEYLELLGGSEADFTTHEGNIVALDRAGFTLVTDWTSSDEEWDEYEGLYAATMRGYLSAHPSDPDVEAFAARIERWSDGYRRWGRDTLGFGLYLARAKR